MSFKPSGRSRSKTEVGHISLNVVPKEMQDIRKHAGLAGCSVSEFIRQAVRYAIANMEE